MLSEGERIKELRQSLNLTQEKFGERLGVTKVAISNIENGKRKVTDQMRKSIFREYGVNESWLLNGTGEIFLSETLAEYETDKNLLETLGFSISQQVKKWHWENTDIDGESMKFKVEDECDLVLSKDGYSAVFSESELRELRTKAQETVEGIFYKKVMEQHQN